MTSWAQFTRPRTALIYVGASLAVAACAGGITHGGYVGNAYQEYECPTPIGKIVREDCSRLALQYDGASFQGSVGVSGVGASASYKEHAVREADSLVAMLKEQRVSLCNNFNTCKMTIPEYRDDQKSLDDSFVALLTLKDKMAQLDAEGAAKLLAEIRKVREGVGRRASATPVLPIPDSPRSAARAYYDAFISGETDFVYNNSSASFRTTVWKTRDELRSWRDRIVDGFGPEKASVLEEYTVAEGRGYFRHLGEYAKGRWEHTIYVDDVTRQITGWMSVAAAPAGRPHFEDALSAGRAYYMGFLSRDCSLVFEASSPEMQRATWHTIGNLVAFRDGVVGADGPEKALVSEEVTTDAGWDRYQRIARYEKRKTRYRIWLDHGSHLVSGWRVEVLDN